MKRRDFLSLIAVGTFGAFRPVVMIPGPVYTVEEQKAFARNIHNEDIRFILYTDQGTIWAPPFRHKIVTTRERVNIDTNEVEIDTDIHVTGCQLITDQDRAIFGVRRFLEPCSMISGDALTLSYEINLRPENEKRGSLLRKHHSS